VRKIRGASRWKRKLLVGAAGIGGVAVLLIFGAANATPSRAQSRSQPQAQNSSQAVDEFKYSIISIKEDKSAYGTFIPMETPGGLSIKGAQIGDLILMAYGPFDAAQVAQTISRIPNSLSAERFDIEAEMDSSVAEAFQKLEPDDRTLARQQMLQALLADRFKLAAHIETKDFPVYWLVVSKPGKIHETEGDCGSPASAELRDAQSAPCGILLESRGHLIGRKISLTQLAASLSSIVGRPVIDKTSLAGGYDVKLVFTPEETFSMVTDPGHPVSAPIGPPLATALEEHLGLRLEPKKSHAKFLMIDHIERPSGN
jgi:uncharacterized protein (TIGR03435 family)